MFPVSGCFNLCFCLHYNIAQMYSEGFFQGAVNLRTFRVVFLFYIPESRFMFTVSPIFNLISKHYENCNVVISMKCRVMNTCRFFFFYFFLASGLSRLSMSGAV